MREPRHFGALSGLGLILQEIGDDKHALEAYRRALAIDPHLENIDEIVKTLREKVEGRDHLTLDRSSPGDGASGRLKLVDLPSVFSGRTKLD